MADPITYSAAPTLYRCGSDFQELKVIIFKGPNDSKACAGSLLGTDKIAR